MKSLLLATGNAHKTHEIQEMLGNEIKVNDLSSLDGVGEIIENANTFEGNADIKALAVSALTDELVVADDSGLCVDVLGGDPGIRSARYAGDHAQMPENKQLLLKNLEGVKPDERLAKFVCVLSLAKGGEVIKRFRGECHGTILAKEYGEGGFGYDPLFVPFGYSKTFAELPAQTKNMLSHRANALKLLMHWVQTEDA